MVGRAGFWRCLKGEHGLGGMCRPQDHPGQGLRWEETGRCGGSRRRAGSVFGPQSEMRTTGRILMFISRAMWHHQPGGTRVKPVFWNDWASGSVEGQVDERSHRWEETRVASVLAEDGGNWAGVAVMGVRRRGWISQRFRVQWDELRDGLAVEGGKQRHQGRPPHPLHTHPVPSVWTDGTAEPSQWQRGWVWAQSNAMCLRNIL